MFASIFTDELRIDDVAEALRIIRSWDQKSVDLRKRLFGKLFSDLTGEEMARLTKMLDEHEMQVVCLESGLAKVHMPDKDVQKKEMDRLDGIVRAAEALDCRLVRSFFYWQPRKGSPEEADRLPELPERMEQLLTLFEPILARAKQEGLNLAFENCGLATWEVTAFLDALGEDAFGIAWDVRNGWFSEAELREQDEQAYIRKLARRSLVVHVKGHGALPHDTDTIPYDRILPLVQAEKFTGPVSVETHNSKCSDPVELSRQILEHVRACIREHACA